MYSLTNTVEPHFEVLRNGGAYGILYPYTAPEVQCVTSSTLKMSLRGTFQKPDFDVNWLTDRIQAGITINGTDYRMGVYIPTTVSTQHTEVGDMVDIEAYSVLYLAQRAKFEGRNCATAGSSYIGVIQTLLRLAGITDYNAESSALVIPFDREFEEGTTILDTINELLAEINYNSAWVNLSGQVQLTKYTVPGNESIKHVYTVDECSVLYEGYTMEVDMFDRANVFKVVCSHPELDEPMIATAENADPESPFSTESIGMRVLYVEEVDNAPDLDTLQEKAFNMMLKSKQATQVVEFATAIMPQHETFDTIAIDHGDMTGIYTETEWRVTLDASGNMTHKAERVMFA